MKNIFKIYLADIRRLSTNVVAVVIIMGLSIIPSLYAWFNIFSNWDPYGPESTSNLKVAVYSEDKGTELDGFSVNVGENVTSGLKGNSSIGWVFSDSEDDAVNGVYRGEYYAAIIIPENFTQDLISFLNGDLQHPKINYYENDKKNAIATKITSKAKTSVQEQVNSSFVSTIAKTLGQISGSVTGLENGNTSFLDAGLNQLNNLDRDLQSYISIMDSFISVTKSASSLISATQVVIPDLNKIVNSGQNAVNSMQGAVSAGTASSQTIGNMVSYSFTLIDSSLNNVNSMIQQNMASLETTQAYTNTSINSAKAVMPYLKELFNNAVAGWQDQPDVKPQITDIQNQMKKIESDINEVSNNTKGDYDTVKAMQKQILDEMSTCKSQINGLEKKFNYSVKPSLDSTMNALQNSLISAAGILNGVNGDFGDVSKVLGSYSSTLGEGANSLAYSKDMASRLKNALDGLITQLNDIKSSGQYQEMTDLLKTNPELLGKFISSPVNLKTEEIYQIKNYGSAMTPFYTTLALWVGSLILVAIIHVKVHAEEGIENVKHYQKYFGRYLIFFTTGQAQTLIAVLGNLFYIKIQCHNPFLYWFAASISSFVFTLFIYSLTVAMGNVGEAIAIVIMVVQVAGAGGTFPVEVLPAIYQNTYKYLPFPYSMNAMRETVGGLYGTEYVKCILILLLYVLLSLFIGLVLAKPFSKLNKMIEKSKERTDIMI